MVQHTTSKKWRERFKERGINATISPPTMQLGQLTIRGQSKITTPGLYVAPPKNHDHGVLIAVKPSELFISTESAQGSCHTPECALYYNNDAIVKGKIPPERVLGSFDYQLKPKERREAERYDSEWVFNPNKIALQDPEMKNIIKCLDYDRGIVRWCNCQ